MTLRQSPCDWPIFVDSSGEQDEDYPECAALDSLTEATREAVYAMATDLLWNWTGRKFGLCETTVYPCRAECPDREATFWANPLGARGLAGGWRPYRIGGEWFNVRCGSCPTRCTCGIDESKALQLPGPVHSIVEIWLGGVKLEATDFELSEGVLFLKNDLVFPACNNLGGDVSDEHSGAWKIVYERGYEVPLGGQVAAARLACELAKAMQNQPCDLPQRVQSVTRQGVTMAILDDFQNLEEGRVGIWEIDSWIAAVTAPRPVKPTVWSPDLPLGGKRGMMQGMARGGLYG